MLVHLWGTRGSVPVPGPSTVRYGGNTACVQIVTSGGTQIILDAGTGMRALGVHLNSAIAPPIQAHVFLTHTHWDHIQGVPYFLPMYQAGNAFSFYSAKGLDKDLREVLEGQMAYTYFPVSMEHLRGQMDYKVVAEEPIEVGDAVIQSLYVNHTVVCMAYRVSADGATVAYVSDHEPYTRMPLRPGREVLHLGDRRLISFVEGADLLIHDAQYSDEEFQTRAGWGHSTARYAASIAVASGAQRLALFHHDPSHDDDSIDREVDHTREMLAGLPNPPEVFGAAEGQELRLAGRQEVTVQKRETRVRPARDRRPRLLVADDDRMVVRMVQQALAEDGYEVLVALDGQEALSLARSSHPDLLILDAVMPKTNGFEVCNQLRQDPALANVPIIMLTSLDDPQFVTRGFKEGASDYITKPFTPTMLRSRIRSWLAGSGLL